MVIRALTSSSEVTAAQADLRREFYEGAEVLEHSVGFPGGNIDLAIAWHPQVGLWGYVDDPDSLRPGGRESNRYWNAFGLQDPHTQRSSLSITVEVNPPFDGTNARVAGILGRDSEGHVLLLHRGKIGGGRSGVGMTLFWEHFSGRAEYVNDGLDMVDCAVVGTLGQGSLVRELFRFAEDVARMKASVRGGP